MSKSKQDLLMQIDNMVLDFIWKYRGLRMAKTILQMKTLIFVLSTFKTCRPKLYNSDSMILRYGWGSRKVLETDPHLIFNRGPKHFHKGRKVFAINNAETTQCAL